MLEKYLQLSPSEIQRNEDLLMEERGEALDSEATGEDLRAADISPGGIDADLDDFTMDDESIEDDLDAGEAAPIEGDVDIGI